MGNTTEKTKDKSQTILDRYSKQIEGVLSCFDRVIIQGTLPGLCFAEGMTSYLKAHQVRIFDYPRFAEPYRDQLRANAERLAQEHGIEIEFMRKSTFRKEARIKEVLAQRGEHPGLVHILSAMEACPTYKPWHDKTTHRTFLKRDSGKCLHYYFYFIDEHLGLCYMRVPTWCPFRLQFYFNGHNRLAAWLRKAGIGFRMLDNAFVWLEDWQAAQALADDLQLVDLHCALDRFAQLYCPVIQALGVSYHWSLMQVEYATDIVFKRQSDLAPVYETIARIAVLAVKADDIATFLGRKLDGNYRDEVGNDFSTRIEGTRIKHSMGLASIKMYDKCGLILRIETTANDVSFFKHHRKVEHRDGTTEYKLAPLKKSIYSLGDLQALLLAANRRYIEFISQFEDPTAGSRILSKVSDVAVEHGRTYRGFNFFADADLRVFHALIGGKNTISGFRNTDLRERLPDQSSGQISRCLKRLRVHGLIKRIGASYKYYLTKIGCKVVVAGSTLKEFFLTPVLAAKG
jgi:hypothetical protein